MKRKWRKYVFVFVLAGLSAAMLLQTSQRVQQAEDELRALERAAENEREAIRVLHAEWAYLNRPERLEFLAAQYLELVPPGPGQTLPSSSLLPDPFVPVIPSQKPAYLMAPQPVSMGAPVSPVIKPKPRPPLSRDNFNALLSKVSQGGHE